MEEEPKYRQDFGELSEEVKIGFDGRQYFIRIPKKISDFFEIVKGDRAIIEVKIAPPPEDKMESTISLKIIRGKKIRENY